MKCPGCDHHKTWVQETRTTSECIWRVRKCKECGWKVTTKEIYAPDEEQAIPDRIRKPSMYAAKKLIEK